MLTFVGEQEAAAEAAFRVIAAAARLIDLNQHQGAHPRFGAADVVPFVPMRAGDMPVCVRRLAGWAGAWPPSFRSPSTSTKRRPARRGGATWPTVRAGEFEGLRGVIETEPSRAPDEGRRASIPPRARWP